MIIEKFEDAIMKINGVGDSKFLKSLIDYADKKCTGKLINSPITSHHRNVYGHCLKDTSASDRKHFHNIQNEITKAYSHYKAKFPFINVGKLLQVDFLI